MDKRKSKCFVFVIFKYFLKFGGKNMTNTQKKSCLMTRFLSFQ
ncbi:hypothetical protein HMPREF9074_07782 [Capnocytophaga sp. oral taxon 329 str. F0087]|nr:hypothetical protein HMPREF9074_07782 [Capnocytophaga sp. oral taxon 329 str. F0087]